jgi:predicted aspartyl protease
MTLNGIEKKFLIDTGGSLNIISSAVADQLKLTRKYSGYRTFDLYGHVSQSYAEVEDVEFGAAVQKKIQFQVMDNLAGFKGSEAPFDGLLSTGHFLREDVDLDFGAFRLNYFSTAHCEGRVVYWPHQGLEVIPIQLAGGHILVPVTLDGHALTAGLDTGASVTLLDIDRAERKLGFKLSGTTAATGAPADDPTHNIYFRRFSILSFGGINVQDPVIVLGSMHMGGGSDESRMQKRIDDRVSASNPDLIIGIEILQHLHMYLALKEQKLYVTEAGQGESVLFKSVNTPEPTVSAVQ